jgi:hypothetical protein
LPKASKSPYISLRDDILSHQNFPEKQEYIAVFAYRYTRKPIITVDDSSETETASATGARRALSCRSIFLLYNEYLTPHMLQTIKTFNGTFKGHFGIPKVCHNYC